MRFVSLPVFAFICGLSAAAYAGSDSSDVPNPFTDQTSPSATLGGSSQVAGVPAVLTPGSISAPTSPSDLAGSANGQDTKNNSGSFYQASKKDAEGR